jgi:hypothetical protein
MRSTVIVRLKSEWTEEDNARLKEFVAQGASIIRAAAALDRSIRHVRIQARKLGAPFPPMRIFRQKFVVSVTSTHRIANSDEEVARSSLSELKIRRTGPS